MARCSFCGITESETERPILAGPGVWICESCVEICNLVLLQAHSGDWEWTLRDVKSKPEQQLRAAQDSISRRFPTDGPNRFLPQLDEVERARLKEEIGEEILSSGKTMYEVLVEKGLMTQDEVDAREVPESG